MNIRVLSGFIEFDYERVAAILPGKDERLVRETIEELRSLDDDDVYSEEATLEYAREAREEVALDIRDFIDDLEDDGTLSASAANKIRDKLDRIK